MILVTTGTNGRAFDRLLTAVASIATNDEVVVQHGPSTLRRSGATCVTALPFTEHAKLVARARVLITHGGVGSVLVGLHFGHRPIVVPRLARFGEAVDDHQLAFGRRLEEAGMVALIEDVADLQAAVEAANNAEARLSETVVRGELTAELGDYLRGLLSERPTESITRASSLVRRLRS